MTRPLPLSRLLPGALLAFAATAVASISLQNITLGAFGALFLAWVFVDKPRLAWPKGPFAIATLVFLATFFLGAFLGVDPANSFKTVPKYLAFLWMFLIAAPPLERSDIQRSLRLLILGGTLCALYGIGYGHFVQHLDRITSFSGDKMVFGGMLMACLLLQLDLLQKETRNWLYWACAALLAVALVMTQTRGAWLGFAAGFTFLTWRRHRRWFLAGVVLMALCVFVLPKPWQERLLNSAHIWVTYDAPGKPHAANETRILIWAAGWEMIKDHPLGVGQGNVSKLFVNYLSPESPMVRSEPDVPHLHDNFLQVTAQNGWQGLAAYLAWIVSFGMAAWSFRSKDPEAEGLNRALTAVFLAVAVWGLTEYTFSHQFMNFQFFLLGLQAALWRVSPKSGSEKGSKGRRTRRAR